MFGERSNDMVVTMQKPSSEPHNDEVVADESSSSSLVEVSPHQTGSPQEARMDEIASLLQFASTGRVEDVRKILDEGLDVNQHDYDGRTALHLAASEGHHGVVELLVERNADVNPVDRWRDTPLMDAMRYVKGNQEKRDEYKRVCSLLVKRGGKGANQEENTEAEQSQLSEEWEQLQEEYDISPEEIDLKKGTLIGEGSFGEVYLVNWRGTKVAAKTVLPKLEQREEIKREFRMELLLLQSLRHPNIVEFLGAVTKTDRPVIVTEYLTNGDLHEIIVKRGRIPARLAVQYALDIARGMNYLHQHKPKAIVHRDLKPRNLLQDEAGNLKVADFGLSKLLEPIPRTDEGYEMTGGTGTYRYMAPEVYLHKNYDKSVDVFSFGIIVNEMFEGRPSQQTDPGNEVANARSLRDRRPQFFAKTYPPSMKELLTKCWDGDPAKRPTFEEIIDDLETMFKDLKPTSRWKPKPTMFTDVKETIRRWRRPPSNNVGGESLIGGGGQSHRGSTRPTDGSVSGSVPGRVHTLKQEQQGLGPGVTAQQHDESTASTSSPPD